MQFAYLCSSFRSTKNALSRKAPDERNRGEIPANRCLAEASPRYSMLYSKAVKDNLDSNIVSGLC